MSIGKFVKLLKEYKANNMGEVIIFCGAGISKKSGLPGFKEFEDFFKDEQIKRELLEQDTNKLMIFWRNLLSKIHYNDNHTKIIRIADRGYIDTIITSNYDSLFEECIDKEFPYWNSKKIPIQRNIKKRYLNEKKLLVKIHGDVEQVKINNINLQLLRGSKVEDAEKEWDEVFRRKGKKVLWVIGYRGKEEDNALKLIKKSIECNEIEKIYWMHKPKNKSRENEIDNILKNLGEEKIELIEIEDANKALIEINEQLFFKEKFNDRNSEEQDSIDKESIKKSYEIANRTIKLLEKVDCRILDYMQKSEEEFNSVLDTGDKIADDNSKLYILRRYNSYTPILPRKNFDSKGGGYFLTYKGKGIVIDPGYDFLENFLWHKYNQKEDKYFRLNHINAIIITHAHNDHYGDFDSIQNMTYQYNKRIKLNKELSEVLSYIVENINMLMEKENQYLIDNIKYDIKKITEDNPKHKEAIIAMNLLNHYYNEEEGSTDNSKQVLLEYIEKVKKQEKVEIDLFLSRSAYKAINGLIPLNSNCFKSINILNPGDKRSWNDINIEAIKVKHQDLYSKDCAIGLKFNNEEFSVGFTSDTGYYIGLEDAFLDCDVLIPHIGSIKPKEINIYEDSEGKFTKDCTQRDTTTTIKLNEELNRRYLIPKIDNKIIETAFYNNHLGILGLSTLLSSIISRKNRLKLVAISEYGEEMNSFRDDITKILKEIYKEFNIITGDIGVEIDFNKIINE